MPPRSVASPVFAALLAASILLPAADSSRAQDGSGGDSAPQPSQRLCFKCRRTGKLPCTLHKLEDDVLSCSVAYARSCCLGLGFTLCEKCKVEAAVEEWEGLKATRGSWLEPRLKLDKSLSTTLVHLETENFRLAFDVVGLEVKPRGTLDVHKAAHLYASRMEAAWKLYIEALGVSDERAKPKHEAFLFESAATYKTFSRRFTGSGSTGNAGWKNLGSNDSFYVTWHDPKDAATDEQFHGRVAHNMAHLMLHKYNTYNFRPPAWLDEGFALLFEYSLTGNMRYFCFVETPPESKHRLVDWRDRIRKGVARRTHPSFSQIAAKELNALTFDDMAYAYSFVDFLIAKDKALFKRFIDAIKRGRKTDDALREAYGWLPTELEDAWRAFVLARYTG